MFYDPSNYDAIQASVLASIISAFGLISMAVFGDMGRKYSPHISAFAVGVLLATTIFHLLPEGYEATPRIWQWVALGFGVFLIFGLLLRVLSSGQSLNTDLAFASSSLIALGTHSFMDGAIYAMAFQGETFAGWTTVIGLLVHQFPEGVIIYYLLRESQLRQVTALIAAFVAACVTTILGTILSLNFLNVAEASLPMMLGLTAGAFIYIIIFHLAPHAAQTPNHRGYMAASIGVVIGMIAIVIEHI